MPAKILIVDDDPDILSGLKRRLEWMGHRTITAKDGAEALTVIQQTAPSLVLLDLELPILSGIQVLERLHGWETATGQQAPATSEKAGHLIPPVIILTAYSTVDRVVEAMKLGACDFLTKPFDPDHLGVMIQKVLERESLKREVTHLRSDLDARYSTIVAESAKMKDVVTAAKRGASSDITILLQGETGTGKELLARSIHRWSSRKNKPFMAVNCAALPEQLLENELFGHERGSFTGATQMQEGKIEAAEGGTVFLDEIGDMPLLLQCRLLRLLQDREFHRVGGTHPIRADIRFLAATNKDLSRAVKDGTFREDLYYRLSMFPVTLPPLRDRQEDTLILARYIIEREGARGGVKKKQLSPGAMEVLGHYHWPGNIRELENVLARAVILSEGSVIHAEELGLSRVVTPQGAMPAPQGASLPYHESMEAHSRWLITEALRRAGGNQTQAAGILELQRTYLTKLMKQKQIPARPAES